MAEIDVRLTGAAGEYMESATVVEWLKRPGDAVREGEPIVVVETAKASTELPAPASGVLARIVAAQRTEVALNGVLAVIEGAPGVEAPTPTLPHSLRSRGGRVGVGASAPGAAAGFPLASPIARRLAKERNLDIATIPGTGPNGRVQERDVLAAQAGDSRREAPQGYRKAMARRMAASAAVPQFSVSLSVDVAPVEVLVATLKADGRAVATNDIVMKATALALREVPRFNARWDGDAVLFHERVNLGMAVATEHGLAVPVIRDADRLSLAGIASASFRLRRRTLGRKLTPADVATPTFTVSNLGLLGAEHFVALLNPPEVGILAVGAFLDVPVVREGRVVAGRRATLTVTGDHRVVDGADAARFLAAMKRLLETMPAETIGGA